MDLLHEPAPILIQRSGTATGWLALAPQGSRWPAGVEGATEAQALERFRAEWAAWEQLGQRLIKERASPGS